MKNWDWSTIILIAALALVLTIGWASISNEIEDKRTLRRMESVISEKNAELEFFRSQTGKLLAQKNAAELRSKELEEAYPEIYNTLKKDFDIKVKDLKAYIKNEFKATGSGNADINNHYTTIIGGKEATSLSVNDGYLAFEAVVKDSLNAPYTYTYSDTIQQAIAVKKKWILGRERLYGTATLSNPNAKVTGSTNVLINDYRDKRFGVGPFIGYNPFTNGVTIGIGVQYSLIKL
jgi:septal ring factor EnvC (AmiA/AmiB activator)